MRKTKLLVKEYRNNRYKIYVANKWYSKDVRNATITLEPGKAIVDIYKYRRDATGHLIVNDRGDEIECKRLSFVVK